MLFFVTLVFFATATLDAVLQIIHVLYAFVWYRGSGGPLGQLSDISYWINPAKAVTYGVQTIFGDGMLVGFFLISMDIMSVNQMECRFTGAMSSFPEARELPLSLGRFGWLALVCS